MGDQSMKSSDPYSASPYGITIHKSQGPTLEKAVELGEKDISAGLTLVAISQVKTLKGLAFHTHFDCALIMHS
jgi:hypothetical protein